MATSKWAVTKTVVICCTSGITPPIYIANIRSQYKDPYERKPVFHVMVMSRFCLRCFSVQENQEEEASHGAKNKRKSEGKENSAGGDWELPSIFRTIRGWRDFFVLDFFFHEVVFCKFFYKIAKKRCQRNGFFLIWSHILMSQEGLNAWILGGGNSKIFGIFTPKLGEMIQFD